MALSRVFWFAASSFAISAHCARGILQNETYEYIAGFSLTSDICAHAGTTQTADIASTHSPAKTLHSFLFMFFILRDLAQDLHGGGPGLGDGSVAPIASWEVFYAGSLLNILRNISQKDTGLVHFVGSRSTNR